MRINKKQKLRPQDAKVLKEELVYLIKKRRIIKVISKMKRIHIKPAIIKTYCNFKKGNLEKNTSNKTGLYPMDCNRQESSLLGYNLFLFISNSFCLN